jgi:electron transport complex protein RnfB
VIEPWCTGCELCIPVCPVDCISLENVTGARTGWDAWSPQEAGTARMRYEFHLRRYPRDGSASAPAIESTKPPKLGDEPAPAEAASPGGDSAAERKRAVIEAALARARARRDPA